MNSQCEKHSTWSCCEPAAGAEDALGGLSAAGATGTLLAEAGTGGAGAALAAGAGAGAFVDAVGAAGAPWGSGGTTLPLKTRIMFCTDTFWRVGVLDISLAVMQHKYKVMETKLQKW